MKKGRAAMDMLNIRTALAQRLKHMEEAGEAATNRDYQAVVAAKIDFLTTLVESANSCSQSGVFRAELTDALNETQQDQAICQHPFLIAGLQIKLGLLESVLRLVETASAPAPSKSPVRGFLVPA